MSIEPNMHLGKGNSGNDRDPIKKAANMGQLHAYGVKVHEYVQPVGA